MRAVSKDIWLINSLQKLNIFVVELKKQFEAHHIVRIKMAVGAGRSLDQNALSHQWYGDVAKQTGEIPRDVKRYCKLHHGILIRRRDPDFNAFYDQCIKHSLSYEQKLKAMDHIAVTSEFSVAEFQEYLDAMQKDYAEQGIVLESM